MRRLLLTLFLLLSLPTLVSAQAITRLASSQTVGTMTTSGDVIDFPISPGIGYGSLGIEARGTWTGTVAIQCIASQGGGTYAALILSPRASTTTVTSFTANGQWSASIVGCQKVRATATAAMTGTVTITMVGSFAGGGGGAGGGGAAGDVNLTQVGGAAIALGQTTMSASLPVAMASDQARAEDAAAASGQQLFPVGCVINSSLATRAADGDYTWLACDVTGTLFMNGTLANDGVAASTNRLGVLPAISAASAAAGLTAGRNASLLVNTTTGGLYVQPTTGSFATDNVFGTATYTEATTTGPLVGAVRTDVPAALANTTNEIAPLASNAQGGLYTASITSPCGYLPQLTAVIDIVTATTTEIIDQSASNKAYICSMRLVTNAANNVAVVEDSDNTCASPSGGLNGGVTAAEGYNFGANGGIADNGGAFSIMQTSATNLNVCIITSAATQLSGTVKYVLAP